jgi:hypothetical protein
VGVNLVTKFERREGTGAPEMRVGKAEPAAKSFMLGQKVFSKRIYTGVLTKGMTNMMSRKECRRWESRCPWKGKKF